MDARHTPHPTAIRSALRWSLPVLLALLAVAGLVWGLLRPNPLQARRDAAQPRTLSERGPLRGEEQSRIGLFREASRSVVYITSLELRREMFTFNLMEVPRGAGSGFIWDEAGHVVTNFHVIQGSKRAEVTLYDQSSWPARVVGVAPDKDLAVLQIQTDRELRPLPIGSSATLSVGQTVLAIGNPFGLDQSLTTGVISAIGREIQSVSGRPIVDVIQTDAAINPGNSGGPLLDSAGLLIGVNTAIYSPSGAYAGVGFAVPVDTVNRIVPQLIAYGRVIRPGLGVEIVPDRVMQRWERNGVLVWRVPSDSAGARAGLRPLRRTRSGHIVGDLIVAVEGERVADSNDLYRVLDRYQVGDRVRLSVERDSELFEVELTLQELR